MAGVERLEQVWGLGPADLADDDVVGPVAQGVPHEVADRDAASAERDELRASLRTLPAGGRHSLNHDAGRTLISFGDRRRDLLAWLPRFGHLRTTALSVPCRPSTPSSTSGAGTLAASTCNHRRHALTNLVRVLYGRRPSFDLLDLVRFAPPPLRPRWVDRGHIAVVLAEVPAGSVTRVRLDLMHWTGMRPSQMGRLRAEDFRLDEPIPYVAVPRGKGGRIAAVPLVPESVAAARAFLDAEAFGPWPRSSVNRALAWAARRAGRPAFTTYQIRHSFAAGLPAGGFRSARGVVLAQPFERGEVLRQLEAYSRLTNAIYMPLRNSRARMLATLARKTCGPARSARAKRSRPAPTSWARGARDLG